MSTERERVAAAFAAKVQRSAPPGLTITVTKSKPKPETVGGKNVVGLPTDKMPKRIDSAARKARVAAARKALAAIPTGHFAARKRELREARVAAARKGLR
jgi:hypothetical protein